MTTLTIRLDPTLKRPSTGWPRAPGEPGMTREALRRQVAVARYRESRRKTLPFAEAQGLVTDEACSANCVRVFFDTTVLSQNDWVR